MEKLPEANSALNSPLKTQLTPKCLVPWGCAVLLGIQGKGEFLISLVFLFSSKYR